jgi:phage terminase large subunit-like protein
MSEREDIKNLFIVAFRGSAKSTIFTTSYPVWAILGEQQKKFVLILCQTQAQAKQHMMNLRRELESNALLKSDLGPFQEENNEWGSSSLVFSRLGARITAVSTEQSVRGEA